MSNSFIKEMVLSRDGAHVELMRLHQTGYTKEAIETAIETALFADPLLYKKKDPKTNKLRRGYYAVLRQIAYTLGYYYMNLSCLELEYWYMQDRTTVYHAIKSITRDIEVNSGYCSHLYKCEAILKGRDVRYNNPQMREYITSKVNELRKSDEGHPYPKAVTAYNEALNDIINLFN